MDSDELAELRALIAAQSAQIGALVAALRPAQASLTLAELYRKCGVARKDSPGWKTNAHMLRPIVNGLPGRFTALGPRDVGTLVVADWTVYRVARDDLAAGSLNLALRCLKAMLRWGKREGLLTAVPQLCDAAKQKQRAHRETAPSEREIGTLLDESDRARGRVIILCACDSGMRNTEIRKLEWSWLDKQRMEINLPAAITKTRKSRTIPITKRQLAAIEAMPRDIRSPLVMPSPRTGLAYSQSYLSTLFRMLAVDAGLKAATGERRVHLHDLRHAYATNAVRRGMRIEVLQVILGHSTLNQTRAYVAVDNADLAQARQVFEAGILSDLSDLSAANALRDTRR